MSANDEISALEVVTRDVLEVVVPWSRSGVRAELLEPEMVQPHDLVMVGLAVAPKLQQIVIGRRHTRSRRRR